MLLPGLERATIERDKLSNYVLNPDHPEGRHKARVFLSALGIAKNDSEWLATAIRSELRRSTAVLHANTNWGRIYRVDMQIRRDRRCAKVRTAWICTSRDVRLVTCFVIGECDETV